MESAPDRRHALRQSQLIEFSNAAAGHDGVLSSQSGDLIVKPCKNSEVTFYQQTWKWDPDATEFAYYMPKFYGTLNLQEHLPSSPSLPTAAVAAAAAAVSSPSATLPVASQSLASPVALTFSTENRRTSHVSNVSAPGTPRSATSQGGHKRSSSRSSMISHLPVDAELAPTKPPKAWEPTHGAKIRADTAVVLENIASGLCKPNILDVKIGARLWADDAHPAKRQKLDKVAGETTSGSLGFRIAGMKTWLGDGAYEQKNRAAMDSEGGKQQDQPQEATSNETPTERDSHGLPTPTVGEDNYASYDREYGRAMTIKNVRLGFEEYLLRPQTGISRPHSREIIQRFIEDLQGLIRVMSNMETRMYSASLLFVYEGDGQALKEDFRRENRMLKEARLAREAIEAGIQSVAIGGTTSVDMQQRVNIGFENLSQPVENYGAVEENPTPLEDRPQLTLNQPGSIEALTGVPVLPRIEAGSPRLNVPAQLILSDAQLAQAASQDGIARAGRDDGDDDDNDEGREEDVDGDEDEDEEEPEVSLPKIQAMKVIDFAHATWTPGQGPDENFLAGVRNVLKVLEEIVASFPEG